MFNVRVTFCLDCPFYNEDASACQHVSHAQPRGPVTSRIWTAPDKIPCWCPLKLAPTQVQLAETPVV